MVSKQENEVTEVLCVCCGSVKAVVGSFCAECDRWYTDHIEAESRCKACGDQLGHIDDYYCKGCVERFAEELTDPCFGCNVKPEDRPNGCDYCAVLVNHRSLGPDG